MSDPVNATNRRQLISIAGGGAFTIFGGYISFRPGAPSSGIQAFTRSRSSSRTAAPESCSTTQAFQPAKQTPSPPGGSRTTGSRCRRSWRRERQESGQPWFLSSCDRRTARALHLSRESQRSRAASTREGASSNLAPGSARGNRRHCSRGREGGRYNSIPPPVWWPPSRPHVQSLPVTPRRARGYLVSRAFARNFRTDPQRVCTNRVFSAAV